jgi:DNA-binding response OmpR family regulator
MARLAIVDDALAQRRILTALLEKTHDATAFESGDALLVALATGTDFDLVLLDIEMPGIDGYETCRRLRALDVTANLPVIFVSAHDEAPERVAAYQAGGDDFIVKPVAMHELQHKVGAMLQQRAELSALADQSRTAQQIAFTAMTSMGELGVLMDFMRHAAACTCPADIADALMAAFEAFGLAGAVQVRGLEGKLERNSPQQAAPLQATVMESLRDMGRIFVFGSRGIVNYAHVSLLAHNLPTDDAERLGRLRDNLALLAEGAETHLAALAATAAVSHLQADAGRTLDALRTALDDATRRAHAARTHNQQHTIELFDTLGRLIESFNITPIQNDTIHHMIEEGIDESLRLFDEAALAEGDFDRVIAMLEKLAKNKT